jgi:branched-chain amino acid transport system ATP-binding protein
MRALPDPDSVSHGVVDSVTGGMPDRARSAPAGRPVLSVRDLTVRFGGIVALDGVSFEVQSGQIVGLIGPNGAGKTTLFNCLSRLYVPERGVLEFEGRPIDETAAHRIAALGISRTSQNVALFPSLTVLQNVVVGAHCRRAPPRGRPRARGPSRRSARRQRKPVMEALLEVARCTRAPSTRRPLA